MLTKKKLETFRKGLEERLEELLSQANDTVTGMTAETIVIVRSSYLVTITAMTIKTI